MTQNLRLEYRTAEELADNPANWRTHPEAQRAALQDALNELDWAGALLFNEATGHLIDGHLRKQLAKGPMPVLIGSWTPEQEKKILATLDPIAAMADPDQAQLSLLLQEISFESDAINAMMGTLIPAPVPNFGPVGADEQGRLDEKKKVECPQCGHEYTP